MDVGWIKLMFLLGLVLYLFLEWAKGGYRLVASDRPPSRSRKQETSHNYAELKQTRLAAGLPPLSSWSRDGTLCGETAIPLV